MCSTGDKVLQQLAEAAANGRSDVGSSDLRAKAGQPGVKINVRSLLLTLIEIASAMGYLHSMGVVHCGEEGASVRDFLLAWGPCATQGVFFFPRFSPPARLWTPIGPSQLSTSPSSSPQLSSPCAPSQT